MDDDNDDNDNSEGDDIDDSEEDSDDDDDDDDEDEDNVDDDRTIHENVDKFILTFHHGDYDIEIDDALSLDRAVTLPAMPTQASYIKPDNWREMNRIGLEKVKQQLEPRIHSVTHNLMLKLTHNDELEQLRDNEAPIVWHEPILDEYWNQLGADWRNQQEELTEIDHIEITNVEITRERLAALVKIFRDGSLTNSSTLVKFNNANLCGEGMVWLSILVDVSSEMEILIINNNRIDSMESVRCLSRSVKSHTRITELCLTHCNLGSNPEILLVILQSDVESIILNNNNIDSLGTVTIAEYLESDPPIGRIDLDRNQLNDDDVILISQSLKRNTNLMSITLHSNNFTSVGVKALLTRVFDSSSLNAISESNHILVWMELFGDMKSHCSRLVQGCIDNLLRLTRIQKIIFVLDDKDSLLQYLANVPVELIPKVLVFSQQHGCQLVYSTMRWWNMPLLYSYYSCVKSDTKRKRSI